MKRYLIERTIPKAGAMTGAELCHAAQTSNAVISRMAPRVQWQHSYVADNKTFCVYLAESEDEIKKHSELSGIPLGRITEVSQIIDPLTANN